MKHTLDCTGLECPMPVVKAKNMLEENENITLDVIVDNETAKENVSKLANSMNLSYTAKDDAGKFIITIVKNSSVKVEEHKKGMVLLVKTQYLGSGDDELGAILMKSFVFSLTQSKPYPSKVIFVNSGVKLTTQNEEVIKNLKVLENEGVEIISCGTCLDFYGLKEELKVGTVGNMYDIVDSINNAESKMSV